MITKEQKIEEIISFVKSNEITAYSIAKATGISEAGIGKILNKLSKNPRNITIDTIYKFLFSNQKENNSTEKLTNSVKSSTPLIESDFVLKNEDISIIENAFLFSKEELIQRSSIIKDAIQEIIVKTRTTTLERLKEEGRLKKK